MSQPLERYVAGWSSEFLRHTSRNGSARRDGLCDEENADRRERHPGVEHRVERLIAGSESVYDTELRRKGLAWDLTFEGRTMRTDRS